MKDSLNTTKCDMCLKLLGKDKNIICVSDSLKVCIIVCNSCKVIYMKTDEDNTYRQIEDIINKANGKE